jgi:hypothetical protein
MPRRSYLQRIAGGRHGAPMLAPPRILFQPSTLPTEIQAGAAAPPAPSAMDTPVDIDRPVSSKSPLRNPGLTPSVESRSALALPPVAVTTGISGLETMTEPAAHAPTTAAPGRAELGVPRGVVGETRQQRPTGPRAEPQIERAEKMAENQLPPQSKHRTTDRLGRAAALPASRSLQAGTPVQESTAGVAKPALEGGTVSPVAPAVAAPARPGPPEKTVRAVTKTAPGTTESTGTPQSAPATIRLEPSAVAPRQRPAASGEKSTRVQIGSLEVRITAPPPSQAQVNQPPVATKAPARMAPPAGPTSQLSRGFRSFGLIQG